MRAPDGAASAAQRARVAQATLEQILENPEVSNDGTIDVLPENGDGSGDLAIHVAGHEVFRVNQEDVKRSGMSAALYAQSLLSSIQDGLLRERRRLAHQRLLQSIAMTVFLGLLAFLALRWIESAAKGTRTWVEKKLADGLSLRNVQLVSAQTLRGSSFALVGVGRVALQLGVAYAYAAFALSQFEATRIWVAPLTQLVTSPFVSLLGRIGQLVPLGLVLLAAVYLLRGVLHLVGFLFDGVARGDFEWSWLPKDLAPAALPLVRGALIVGALLAFGPLVRGDSDALLTRLGLIALAAVFLASVPAAAAAVLGTVALFGRRYRIGEWVTIGRQTGEVTHVGFLDLTLVPLDAGRLRLSHLTTLWLPVRHLPGPPPLELELPVRPDAAPDLVVGVLREAFAAEAPEIELSSLTSDAALYRIRFKTARSGTHLATAVTALMRAGLNAPARGRPG